MGNAEYMGSAVQSSPLTSTLTMRAFLTVFLAVAVCGEADPYTIGQVLTGRTAGGVITGVTYPGVGAVAGFPYTAVHHPFYYGKREAEAEPESYTIGQVLTGQTAGGAITHVDYGHGLPKVAGFPYTAVHTVAPVVHHGVVGYSHPVVYGKREAEAEPFYGYAAGVVPYVHQAAVVAPTALGHAVAVTGYGHVTHSSNVGVCTNVAGVQVPCWVEKEQQSVIGREHPLQINK